MKSRLGHVERVRQRFGIFMKRQNSTFVRRIPGACLTAFLAAFLAGCSSEPAAPERAITELRGEPISPATPEIASAPETNQNSQTLADIPPNPETAPVQTAPAEPVDVLGDAPIVSETKPPVQASADQSNASSPGAESSPEEAGRFLPVTFDELASFHFDISDEEVTEDSPTDHPDQIPPAIRALNQKKVALKGFMLPLKVESGLVTEMLIMRDQSMCCYGTIPQINEWVSVKMSPKGVKAIMDQPVTVFGKLQVGEMRENGYLVGIYQMEGEKVAGPLDL
jgi:hypothetical protein